MCKSFEDTHGVRVRILLHVLRNYHLNVNDRLLKSYTFFKIRNYLNKKILSLLSLLFYQPFVATEYTIIERNKTNFGSLILKQVPVSTSEFVKKTKK